jgi:4,5-dihydroxyphthalate decarboxylase
MPDGHESCAQSDVTETFDRDVERGAVLIADLKLKTVTRTQGNNAALKDGTVKPRGFAFDFEEVPVLIDGFRRMVRGLEFDVSEMAITTYLSGREHGVRFTALPTFLVRAFHHGAIVYNTTAGIRSPKDLEGRRVGVNRGYTVTTGVWARGILQDEHGVDLSKITWMLSGDEHVAEYRPPPNVERIEGGKKLADMVASGELPAAVGVSVDHPDVEPLIPNPTEAGFESLRARGLYPLNHLVVIKDDLLEAHPGLAAAVFDAFAEAKNIYVRRLREGAIDDPSATDRFYERVMQMTGDPLPYGVEPNRAMIDVLIRHAVTQRILAAPVGAEDLFAKETLDLIA